MNRVMVLATALVGASIFGCAKQPDQQSEPPPQGYYQPAPQPGAPPPAQPAPAPAPQPTPAPAATPAPATTAAPAASSTPTAIPGVMKNADGTCSITPPGGQPINGPCPPGL